MHAKKNQDIFITHINLILVSLQWARINTIYFLKNARNNRNRYTLLTNERKNEDDFILFDK